MIKSKWVILVLVMLLLLSVTAVFADTTYTVQPGDSLAKIAQKFGTTVEAIVEENDIGDPNLIQVGMVLTIPTDGQPAAEEASEPDLPPPAAEFVDPALSSAMQEPGQYVVQLGDSLAKIATSFGLDYLSLALINAVAEPYILQVGQVLEIPNPLAEMGWIAEALQQLQTEADAAPQAVPVQPESIGEQSEARITATSVLPGEVRIYETTISIPTENYEDGFVETEEGDDIYPYPRMDQGQVGGASPRDYRAIVMENGYVSVMVLPELGGRVYGWKDKATGRELLYQNPVVKPTDWGYRGWWLAAGGIEWAFPVEEHGLNEWRPWEVSIGDNSISVSNVEDRTGMEVGATISLSASDAVMTLQPWARNSTDSAQEYQLWLNGMMAMGDNDIADETQFILPVNEVKLHSTGDGSLPAPGEMMGWPVHNGRDLSAYGNWEDYLGFFAPTGAGYSGIYDHGNGQGMVRALSPGLPAATKIFGPGSLPPWLWTYDDSGYVELWSGATNSFWDYTTLEPGDTVSWSEYWYPVHGMGGYNFANKQAALRLDETESGAEVALAVSAPTDGNLILWAGNEEVAGWPVHIGPGQSMEASWERPSGLAGTLGLTLTDDAGAVVAQTGQVP